MRTTGTQLFDEFAKDFAQPMPEHSGAHMAEVMENKLSNMLEEHTKRMEAMLANMQPKQPEVIPDPTPEEVTEVIPDPTPVLSEEVEE